MSAMTKQGWLALVTRGRCMACQKETDDAELEIDHVIPHKRGASRCLCNNQILCRRCNDSKGTNARDYRDEFVRIRLIAGCGCQRQDCYTCVWWHNGRLVGDGAFFFSDWSAFRKRPEPPLVRM